MISIDCLIKKILSETVRICRIFQIIAGINSGTILSLLSAGAVFLGLSIYNTDHVSMSQAFRSILL